MSDAHDDEPAVTMDEPGRPVRAAGARAQVSDLMTAWAEVRGQSGSKEFRERLYDALLACSELVSNAYRHGGGLTRFTVGIEGSCVRIEVDDRSRDLPVTCDHGTEGSGGFGWALVRRVAVSTEVRVHPEGSGKSIVARLPLS